MTKGGGWCVNSKAMNLRMAKVHIFGLKKTIWREMVNINHSVSVSPRNGVFVL